MPGPNFRFSDNIPQADQKIAATQEPILSNFKSINEYITVNHVGFDDPINYGKHKFTNLVFQESDPITTSDEMALYSKTTSDAQGAQIFYRYPSNGSVKQLSSGAGAGGATQNGYVYYSPTVLMKWGLATGIIAGQPNTIVFPTDDGIPSFTQAPFTVYFSPASSYTFQNSPIYVNAFTNTQFVLNIIPASYATSVWWMAIGA